MTKAEFIAKYGTVPVKFTYYYKYAFTFTGLFENKRISVTVGGRSDEIYRLDVDADQLQTVGSLDPFSGECGDDEFYDY